MTKVEELRENLVKTLTDAWGGHNAAAIMMADNIIAAARAEGYLAGYRDARGERDYDPLGVDYEGVPNDR